MEEIIALINTAGFPIACVVFLGLYVRELTASHKEEIKQLSESLTNIVSEIKDLSVKITTLIEEERNDRRNEDK